MFFLVCFSFSVSWFLSVFSMFQVFFCILSGVVWAMSGVRLMRVYICFVCLPVISNVVVWFYMCFLFVSSLFPILCLLFWTFLFQNPGWSPKIKHSCSRFRPKSLAGAWTLPQTFRFRPNSNSWVSCSPTNCVLVCLSVVQSASDRFMLVSVLIKQFVGVWVSLSWCYASSFVIMHMCVSPLNNLVLFLRACRSSWLDPSFETWFMLCARLFVCFGTLLPLVDIMCSACVQNRIFVCLLQSRFQFVLRLCKQ